MIGADSANVRVAREASASGASLGTVPERSRPPGSEAADRLCIPDEDIFSLRIASADLPDRCHGNAPDRAPGRTRVPRSAN